MIHDDAKAVLARRWIGSIQWVAQSPLRPHRKRMNCFIGIFELPEQPKTGSAARAIHVARGLSVVARDERSLHRNKALAKERIAALIRLQTELEAITALNNTHAADVR